ncbi:tRNA uridine-5-carboxymethylaminomethyl(34) synthesis enzyme MnmG, partial [Buchnera aphidicola (Hormaphis cornu)]
GGIGKGHLVKEIDALGGLMAHIADKSGIQFRMLNTKKGAAVRSTRAQIDRKLYQKFIFHYLQKQKNLSILEQEVEDLIIKNNRICGVVTNIGNTFNSQAVVLTTGTFLNGQLYIGNTKTNGGRKNDSSSIKLSNRLKELPFKFGRLKTGTPPRIERNSINFNELKSQHSDNPLPVFSFLGNSEEHPKQIPCHITHTNEKTHNIIQKNIRKSPMYSGLINATGPRYCPSLEDKIMRFPNRLSHQIFLEPEGLTSTIIYPNGISTSFPVDIQEKIIQSIKGLEQSRIVTPGYAVEYDFFDPRNLKLTLENKFIEGLFFAGQINGTTGYEEAAGQGLLAGLNAALSVTEKPNWYPRRDQAYLGVLIDDLCTKGTKEPYRMFTSRAEYRLILRENNADLRLTETGKKLGLIDESRWSRYNQKIEKINKEFSRLNHCKVNLKSSDVNILKNQCQISINDEITYFNLLKKTGITYKTLQLLKDFNPKKIDIEATEHVELEIKYEGYINRQKLEIQRQINNENSSLPLNFNYTNIKGLSNEAIDKLNKHQPMTIGQASRIEGITPAAISILIFNLKNQRFNTKTFKFKKH